MTLNDLLVNILSLPEEVRNYEARIFLEKKEKIKPEVKDKKVTVTATQQIKYLEIESGLILTPISVFTSYQKSKKNEH